MRSHQETEVKLRVLNPRKLRQRLKELGFQQIMPRLWEHNLLFDFPDARLARSHRALRLRRVGNECFLTLKGPPRASKRYKMRREFETRIQDPGALRKILQELQLQETFQYRKHRTTYAPVRSERGRTGLLLYDETPVGKFVELEGPPHWIDRTARALGYRPEDYITTSYVALYRQAARRLGRVLNNQRTRRNILIQF
jgi:adenylate cyclase class 2